MSEVINLRKARKAAARDKKESEAARNRLLYGRPLGERKAEDARAAHLRNVLDAHRIDPGDKT